MRNAIPREASAIVTIPAENEEELLGLVKYCEDLFNEEFSAIETPISFKAERVDMPAGQIPEEIQDNLVDAIFACQNGVTRMIPTVPDTVETSSNLAIISIGGGKADIKILARSSSDSMKEYLTTSLECCFSMAGMLSLIHILYDLLASSGDSTNSLSSSMIESLICRFSSFCFSSSATWALLFSLITAITFLNSSSIASLCGT